jgi:serine/threonine protein kinase
MRPVAEPRSTLRSDRLSAARTLTRRKGWSTGRPGQLLAPGQVLRSPQARLEYRALRLLGAGGFGQVYLARRLGRSSVVPATLCIKVGEQSDVWVREAYFGQLLDGHPRAVRVFDSFPVVRPDGRFLYCLALEYARHGDLRSFLHRHGEGWPERAARREIAGILQVLGKLHRGHVLHRDLTPMNVFVGQGRRLKLGDFGLVRHQSDRRGTTVDALNPMMAPSDIALGAVPKW